MRKIKLKYNQDYCNEKDCNFKYVVKGKPSWGATTAQRLGEGMKYTGNCFRNRQDCEKEGFEGKEVTSFC